MRVYDVAILDHRGWTVKIFDSVKRGRGNSKTETTAVYCI
jgi:hypothetical protein